jgi:hypothetical protein
MLAARPNPPDPCVGRILPVDGVCTPASPPSNGTNQPPQAALLYIRSSAPVIAREVAPVAGRNLTVSGNLCFSGTFLHISPQLPAILRQKSAPDEASAQHRHKRSATLRMCAEENRSTHRLHSIHQKTASLGNSGCVCGHIGRLVPPSGSCESALLEGAMVV